MREFADIERFIDLMNAKPSFVNGTDTINDIGNGDIKFNDVWFEYPSRPGEDVLKGLTLQVWNTKT